MIMMYQFVNLYYLFAVGIIVVVTVFLHRPPEQPATDCGQLSRIFKSRYIVIQDWTYPDMMHRRDERACCQQLTVYSFDGVT